jgi:hypothetical protein
MGRALVNKTMQSGGKMKKAQTGVSTKKGRTTMNIDSSGYAAGKKAGFPAQMISPKTKYSKGDTTNVTVNRNTISKAIKKSQNGTMQNKYVKNLQPMGNATKVGEGRYKSEDGNYKMKFKGGDGKTQTPPTSMTQRRTLKGLLSGASKAAGKVTMKTGGMTKKCKYGCK